MGRPPHGGGPVFRFTPNEVMEMEAYLQDVNMLTNLIPPRDIMYALAEKFSASPDRVGKAVVQTKQVLNWFQNRRYAQRTKVREPVMLSASPVSRDAAAQFRNVSPPVSISQGSNSLEKVEVEFEAKSARDGAWYDVSAFCSHRLFETCDPEVQIHFSGFGVEEDEWINVRKCVRQRSLPCEAAECATILPGDLILCFQEGKEQALYFDAHVLDTQRRRHDVRGCRCRFLVRYDHDQSEEIVSLRKICRRPETDYRLGLLQSSVASGSVDAPSSTKGSSQAGMSKDENLIQRRAQKQHKLMDMTTDGVMTIALPVLSHLNVPATVQTENAASTIENNNNVAQDPPMNEDTVVTGNAGKPEEINTKDR